MKLLLPLFFSLLFCGCANIVLRTPISSQQISQVYEPTTEQAKLVHDFACPQSFFIPTGRAEFCIENVFTLPLAVVPAVDLVAECVLDTLFLPVDAWLVTSRTE